jgi:hypothetical protein
MRVMLSLACPRPSPLESWRLRCRNRCGYIDQRGVSTCVVEAVGDEITHVQLAHVAERHRRTGRAALVRLQASEEFNHGRI